MPQRNTTLSFQISMDLDGRVSFYQRTGAHFLNVRWWSIEMCDVEQVPKT